jgi:serine/threonine protein kinase, bacterial
LYECLSGRPARSGKTPEEIMFNILNRDVEPIRASCPAAPEALERILTRALSRDVTKRFASARELLAALTPFLLPTFAPADTDTTQSDQSVDALAVAPLKRKSRNSKLQSALLFVAGVGVGVVAARTRSSDVLQQATPTAVSRPPVPVTERALPPDPPPASSAPSTAPPAIGTEISAPTAAQRTPSAGSNTRSIGSRKPPPVPRRAPHRDHPELRHSTALDEKNPYAN